MGRNRLERIDTLYRAALSVPPEQRSEFLKKACRSDRTLRVTVESLLVHQDRSSSRADTAQEALPLRVERRSRFRPSDVIGGRFEITGVLGSGGMGDVYEVQDLSLGDRVALKTIRPDLALDQRMVARFKQEILVAKRVTHPNVCRIYDVGFHAEVLFLTMELLRGESLASRLRRGRMTTAEALAIVQQMARGLQAAHDAGVVHRDFKCANVMLVPAGSNGAVRAVVTDFGLARLLREDAIAGVTATLTEPGEVAGTPDYMAPEQVLGSEVTPAADIYALGVVMYEMLTGALPFDGGTPLAILTKRLVERPVKPREHVPDLDPVWEQAILRCLERDPRDRFASAEDVARALSGVEPVPLRRNPRILRRRLILGAGAAGLAGLGGTVAIRSFFGGTPSSSIAVLPLANVDAELDYVTEGMTEDLINLLGQTQGLRVMSRAAVYRFKDAEMSPQELGRRLEVRYVLTGRVLKKRDTVSLAVELTDTRDNAHVWGRQYERPVASLADVEQDVARTVLAKLQMPLGEIGERRFAEHRWSSPEVNELYWRARFFWNKRTQEGLQRAMEYFQQAVQKDPTFARGYAGLADCYAMRSGVVPPRETFPSAKAAAIRAIELDDSLAEAHASLAFALLYFDWDWPRAEAEYLKAIELNPNYPTAHSMYGMYLVAMKRFEEAMQQMRRALELDPPSLAIHTGVGRVLLYARRYDEAAMQYSKTLEMDPKFAQALIDFGITRAAQGRIDESIRLLQQALDAAGEDAGALAQIAYAHRLAGRTDDAAATVRRLQALMGRRYVSPYFLAVAHIGGDNESALTFLDQAYGDRSFSMVYLNVDPRLDRLRLTPRFGSLLRAMRFV